MGRIMVAGTGSGAGKTTVTIGLIKALVNRGYKVSSFKCGPDYIDTMFHKKIVGVRARNLDSVFCDEKMLRHLVSINTEDISVIEGVMGYYDGVGLSGSSMEISRITKTPAIIVIDCKGMSMSIGAVMKGFLTFRENNHIVGFLFNRLPKVLEDSVKQLCDELNTGYFGRLPFEKEYCIASRHLGLVTADETDNLREKVEGLARLCEENLMLDRIIDVAGQAERLQAEDMRFHHVENAKTDDKKEADTDINSIDSIKINDRREAAADINDKSVRIALADDRAFSFIYQDNIDFLERMGIEIVRFSPLDDEHVPYGVNGLILPGGYPELYAKELSENKPMLKSIREAVNCIPTIAECGGFMYLHSYICTQEGEYGMVGVINGKVHNTGRLVRFGYVKMESEKDNLFGTAGTCFTAHEFHYWDSDNNGNDYAVTKLSREMNYRQGHAGQYFYGGFPHIYFYGNVEAAMSFVEKCKEGKNYCG